MRRAHFFDIDSIIVADSQVWLVDKKSPGSPLLRIPQSDFNLVRSGIYKSQGNDVAIGGAKCWFPDGLFSELKHACSAAKCDISNLAFSMQEFMNREVIEKLDYSVNYDLFAGIKNSPDDIYFVCSRNSKSNYEAIIKKVEVSLRDLGLSVQKYYFVSETFYSRNVDEIARNKVRLALQHLVGFKTDGNRFSAEELARYDEVFLYDDEPSVIKLALDCNHLLMGLIDNSEEPISVRVREAVKVERPVLEVCEVTSNRVNSVSRVSVPLAVRNLIRTFESFKWNLRQ